jgi:hypothetical protein
MSPTPTLNRSGAWTAFSRARCVSNVNLASFQTVLRVIPHILLLHFPTAAMTDTTTTPPSFSITAPTQVAYLGNPVIVPWNGIYVWNWQWRTAPATVKLTGYGAAYVQVGPITGTIIAAIIEISLLCSTQTQPTMVVQFALSVDFFFVSYSHVWNLFSMGLGFTTPPNSLCN